MNTMNVTKKPRDVVTPPPKKYQWTEVPIKNKEGVVVKRPLEEEPVKDPILATLEDTPEPSEEEIDTEVVESVTEHGDIEKDSTDGI